MAGIRDTGPSLVAIMSLQSSLQFESEALRTAYVVHGPSVAPTVRNTGGADQPAASAGPCKIIVCDKATPDLIPH
jgi:hypothetical protein